MPPRDIRPLINKEYRLKRLRKPFELHSRLYSRPTKDSQATNPSFRADKHRFASVPVQYRWVPASISG